MHEKGRCVLTKRTTGSQATLDAAASQLRYNEELHPREIPVTLDTKFIERNSTPIEALLRSLQTESDDGELDLDRAILPSTFLVWTRFSARGLSYFGADLGIFPVEEFRDMNVPVHTVVIIENKVSFLRFPPTSEPVLLVWGQGRGCLALKTCPWIGERQLYYWGDMDLEGLSILSDFRRHFPTLRSFLMDTGSYRQFQDFAVAAPLKSIGAWFNHLTPEEQELATYLADHPERSRLEQERITPDTKSIFQIHDSD